MLVGKKTPQHKRVCHIKCISDFVNDFSLGKCAKKDPVFSMLLNCTSWFSHFCINPVKA